MSDIVCAFMKQPTHNADGGFNGDTLRRFGCVGSFQVLDVLNPYSNFLLGGCIVPKA
jgi:hypothetical protein